MKEASANFRATFLECRFLMLRFDSLLSAELNNAHNALRTTYMEIKERGIAPQPATKSLSSSSTRAPEYSVRAARPAKSAAPNSGASSSGASSSSSLAATFSKPNLLAASGESSAAGFESSTAAPSSAGAITFEEVVEAYHGKVFQLVFRYTGDYEEACDLTQDTFVRAYRAWNEFRGDSQIYTWLYRIALNLCHNSRKKGDRRRRVEGISLDYSVEGDDEKFTGIDVADVRPQPSKSIENDELRARLQEALASLPENYRTVIVLRDIEGLPYEEIARITDSTLEAIKSRLFRARTMLREILAPYLFGSSPEPESTSVPSGSRRFSWKKAMRHDKKRQEKL